MEFDSPSKPHKKLTDINKEVIRARWAKRDTYKSLAEEYGTTWRRIQDIVTESSRRKRDQRYREKKKREAEA